MKSKKYVASICAMALVCASSLYNSVEAETSPCAQGFETYIEYRVFFGRNNNDVEVVTDEAWQVFLEDQITPRFPDGLSVVDVNGQWRDSSGTIIKERTKLLIVLAPPGDKALELSKELIDEYKSMFKRGSALLVTQKVCASFAL